MTFEFHPDAEAEFLNAIGYYEGCESGLGQDFALEIYSTIQNILSCPKAWPLLDDEIRRCMSNRFPYGILYSVEADRIYILAVMHLHRQPNYWKQRQ